MSIATVLSQKAGRTLPWKTVKDVITASLNARFTELDGTSGPWPCDFPAAQSVKLKVTSGKKPVGGYTIRDASHKCLVAQAELEPSEIQDLGDAIPDLLALKARFNVPMKFHVRLEVGDGKEKPSPEAAQEINDLLKKVKEGFEAR